MTYSISIAMTLYNGEKFLIEQLESINNQTVQPSELHATDDGSTDSTAQIFADFVKNNGLEGKWHYHKNEENLGYTENFLHCAELCKGDIVFFSDQDDIWLENKIEKMISVLEDRSDVEAVVCGYDPYSNGQILNSFLEKIKRIGLKDGIVPFSCQVKNALSGGLTLCVRSKALINLTSYIRNNDLVYDVPVGLICAAKESLYRVNEPLVLHRIHTQNTGDPIVSISGRLNGYERHIKGRKFEVQNLEGVREACFKYLQSDEQAAYDREIQNRKKEIEYLEQRNRFRLFISLFRIGRYDNKIMDIANFLCCIRKSQ